MHSHAQLRMYICSQVMVDIACNYITCSNEDVGNINISFTTCRRPFQVSAVISNISNTGHSRRSRASTTTFTITDTVFLDISVNRISNGVCQLWGKTLLSAHHSYIATPFSYSTCPFSRLFSVRMEERTWSYSVARTYPSPVED